MTLRIRSIAEFFSDTLSGKTVDTERVSRFHLVYLGFMKEKSQLPGLLQQEKQALETQILLIYHQYLTAPDETKKKQYLDEFIE